MPVSATCDICQAEFTERDFSNRPFNGYPDDDVVCVDCKLRIDQIYNERVAAVDRAAIVVEEKNEIANTR